MDCANQDLISVEHEEEMLVLKSIFNEDFISVDNENHQLAFDLVIRFDSLPNKITLVHDGPLKISTEILHLPPITLHITCRKTYPKVDSPFYCIHCDYLTCDQLLVLANELDSLWIPGEVIVYTWVETLKEYFYNKNNQLVLSETKSSINDKRFLTNYDKIGLKKIYEQLVEYNRLQNQLEFEQKYHICPICLEEKLGKDCLRFEKCLHYACLPCLKSHAKEYLSNTQPKTAINCYDCDSPLFLSELRRIFSDDQLLSKYQQRLLEQTVDMVWCPRCHHSIICIPSESTSGNHRSFVECFNCQFTFCRRCEQTWHPQIECPKSKLLESMKTNPNMNDSQNQKINTVELNKLLMEFDNIQIIEQCTKPCPSCSVRIEKNGGCQHMHCRACQIHFCWVCGWYGKAYGPHPCKEKPEVAERALPPDLMERFNHVLHDKSGNIIPNAVSQKVQLCPRENCRLAHIKIGTKNLLKCGECGTFFCFLCGETVYGAFHFSEYACKLYTRL